MPRPARVIAMFALALSLFTTGIASAYARGGDSDSTIGKHPSHVATKPTHRTHAAIEHASHRSTGKDDGKSNGGGNGSNKRAGKKDDGRDNESKQDSTSAKPARTGGLPGKTVSVSPDTASPDTASPATAPKKASAQDPPSVVHPDVAKKTSLTDQGPSGQSSPETSPATGPATSPANTDNEATRGGPGRSASPLILPALVPKRQFLPQQVGSPAPGGDSATTANPSRPLSAPANPAPADAAPAPAIASAGKAAAPNAAGPTAAAPEQAPRQMRGTAAAAPDIPYRATQSPVQRAVGPLVAMIAVFIAGIAAIVIGAGRRGGRNVR